MFVVGIWSARLLTCRERVRLISLHDLSFVRVNHNNCGLYYCHYTPPPAENTVPVFPNLALISKHVAFVTYLQFNWFQDHDLAKKHILQQINAYATAVN